MADSEQNYVTLETAEAFARERLSEKRYAHTVRVTETAGRLASIHALDGERTRLAALLHDAAREMPAREYLRLARDWDLRVGDFERENPKLLHGPVAAVLARLELGVEDGEVLEAIRVHTTGAPGMSGLALAVYVADKIEPARDYPSVERLRGIAEDDLRASAREVLRRAIAYNEQRGREVHPESRRTLQWLEEAENAP
ncbi:MAG TPA: bis(5'-nucleosyl)-tetraphosphatase (symmetrical) YqeK [Rubrobacteraceae bacterium]|nr:bis(5'-nucleosyl)-tetraphosphatase (symmetrical) YqeK [Rubrobacteraceae bacterium]